MVIPLSKVVEVVGEVMRLASETPPGRPRPPPPRRPPSPLGPGPGGGGLGARPPRPWPVAELVAPCALARSLLRACCQSLLLLLFISLMRWDGHESRL